MQAAWQALCKMRASLLSHAHSPAALSAESLGLKLCTAAERCVLGVPQIGLVEVPGLQAYLLAPLPAPLPDPDAPGWPQDPAEPELLRQPCPRVRKRTPVFARQNTPLLFA